MRSEASEVGNQGGRGRARARRWAFWSRRDQARKAQRRRETLEALEARQLLATVPAPIVLGRSLMPSGGTLDNTGNASNESDPTIAVNRYNSDQLVAAWVRFDADISGTDPPDIVVEAAYSVNGGSTWQTLNLGGNLFDPNTTNPTIPYNRAIDPSVAFDAQGNFYILATHQNADGSSGALVLDKFNLSQTGVLSTVFTNRIVYQWVPASDRAVDASIAVDNGPATFTDPDTGATQNNPFSGNVYIGWATVDVAPANNTLGDNYNPNRIVLISSSDGGNSFGGYSVLNDNGNFGLQRNARPRIAVSQGTINGQIAPGRVTVVWDDFGSGRNASPPVDIIEVDRPAAGINANFTNPGGFIADAFDPGNSAPHVPAVTEFPINVNITDPRFLSLSDLDVELVISHPQLQELQVDLVAPDGTTITLFNNQNDEANTQNQFTGISGANLGILNGTQIGTTFNQQATRSIIDFTTAPPARGAAAPFVGHFRPEGGNLSVFNGRSPAQLNGTWRIVVTDHRAGPTGDPPPRTFLESAELKFRHGLAATADVTVANSRVIGSITDTFGRNTAINPTGVGPNAVIAQDNTLGSFSPFQGRLYVSYVDWDNVDANPDDNTDIYLAYSDNGGLSWVSGIQVNDDQARQDGFSEGDDILGSISLTGRAQFQPSVAVDQATGTLALSWYDGRHDAARGRVATFLTTSIDGGNSFSEQIFANQPRNVVDAITGQVVTTEPIPDNQSGGNANREGTFGFGDNQGLAFHGGRIYPIWSSNLNGGADPNNLRRLDIQSAVVSVAAGPRIVDSTMGVVGLTDQFGNVIDPINNTRTADGTPIFAGFEVTFDRRVDPATFGIGDVSVFFRDATPGNTTGGPVPVLGVVPLDLNAIGATRFRVTVQPRSAVGTYSYVVGPDINDRIRTVTPAGAVVIGNRMDQDADGQGGELPATGVGPGDVYAAPRPTATGAGFVYNPTQFFAAPYDSNTLPLILSGPRAIASRVPGTPSFVDPFNPTRLLWAYDNLALDRPVSALDVTFDRDMRVGSFTGTDVLRIQAPTGELIRPTPFQGLDVRNPADDRPIPDLPSNNVPLPLVSTLAIPGDGTFRIADLDLRLDIDHPDLAQLTIELQGPDGTKVTLIDGLPGTALSGTILDDESPLSLNEGSSPYTGRFRPTGGALSAFDGKELGGTWRLIVTDNTTGQTGTLRGWTLEATPLPQVAPVFNATTGPAGSQELSVPIANGATVVSDLVIPANVGAFTIADLNVTLDITHSRPADLAVTLIAPDGTQVPLFAGLGGPLSRDFRNTTLDDEAATPINQAPSTSFTGIYRPQGGSLSALDGKPIQGTWRLRIVDTADAGATGGTLNSWSLTATPQNPAAAVARTFRVSFPTQRIGGAYAVSLGADILSGGGHLMDMDTDAGVDLLRGTAPAAPTVPANYASSDVPKATVNGGTIVSILNVPDDFLIADLNVRLNITHTLNTDLTAVLVAPDGTRITLFDQVGAVGPISSRRNFTNTVLDDQATTPIQNGASPFFGSFNPQQPLGVLNGTNARGLWTLELTDLSGGGTGTLTSWTLEFRRPVPNTGLGEPVADRSALAFRIFGMDPNDPLSGAVWTPVGPASISQFDPDAAAARQGYSGRVSAIVVDPSDPSGNTVYIGAASGGVWRTNNFLTTDPNGPTWTPLTDFGPTFGVHIGSIAIFPRNNDPNQSIILAATGEASTQYGFGSTGAANAPGSTTQGVGFLRSMDGGATWELLDSTDNRLPFTDRDHAFAINGGTAAFEVLLDPTEGPAGEIIGYAALSGPSGGLWRTLDAGTTWQLMRAGEATDIILDEFSRDSNTGNLNTLYAAFAGEGVFQSPNRGQSFNLMTGQIGVPQLRDSRTVNNPAVTVTNLPSPNGAFGRITLAKPALVPDTDPNAQVKNTLYQGWLYAVVANTAGTTQGLYLTKDFGQTWTQLQLPTLVRPGSTEDRRVARPSNNVALPDEYDAPGSLLFANPEYTLSLVVDPNNPEIVYLGGTSIGQQSGLLRIDVSRMHDAHALIGYNHSGPDGGQLWTNTNNDNSAAVVDVVLDGLPRRRIPPTNLFLDGNQYTNLIRHPDAPFLASSAILIDNIASFTNDGRGVRWTPYDAILLSNPGDQVQSTNIHAAVSLRDPLTGNSRLLFGNDQGIFSGVAERDGSLDPGIGNLQAATFSRVGNLQISQLWQGAAQPTTLAAQLAGALFYGMTQGNGYPTSTPDILDTGTNWWFGLTSGELNGAGVATDQQGNGTVYQYKSPGFGDNTFTFTEFFQVNGVPRTFGLIQTGGAADPQWPSYGPIYNGLIPMGRFAVNPLNGDQIVISSNAGRIFATTNQGVTWSVIGDPADLDGTYAPAVAYGAPDPSAPGGVGNLGNFIYAGTIGGNIFVSRTGGGSQANAWQNISTGLDGSSVAAIITSPDRGSREAYAVTLNGVYYTPDSITTPWQSITGNLFSIQQAPFGDLDATSAKLEFLTSIQADWRYAIPENFAAPNSPTHPVLYVGGNAGVYRSLDNGLTWALFPTVEDGAPRAGGYLPGAPVTDLDMAIGRIDPTNGRPVIDANTPNILMASTFGRGAFALRLAPQVLPTSLAFAPGSDSGRDANDRVTNVVTPTINGLSAQSAFGSVITINLIDLTDPARPVIIGTGTTDEFGRFSIQVDEGHFLPDGSTDGLKVIGVQAIDQAGTRGNIVRFEFVLDTIAPAAPGAPDLQAGSDSGLSNSDNITRFTTLIFDIASGEPATTIMTVLRNGLPVKSGPVNDLSPVTTLTDDGPVQPDGVYRYTATQVDLAGNVSAVSGELRVTVDTTAPNRPSRPTLEPADDTGVPGDNITSIRRPRFNGTTDNIGLMQLLDEAGNVIGSTPVNGGPYTIQPDQPFAADNIYNLQVRAIDVAGNQSQPSQTFTIRIDTTAPNVPTPTLALVEADDTGVIGDLVTSNRRPRFEGRAAAGEIVELVQLTPNGPKVLATGIATADNRYLLRPTVGNELPEGPVTLQTRVRDVAGNQALSNTLTVIIDTTSPEGSTTLRLRPSDDTGVPGDNITSRRRPIFEGTTEPNSTVELIDVNGNTLVSGTADSQGNFALSLPQSLRNGTITLRARARDVAGNQGGPSAPVTVRIVTVRDDYDGDGLADAAVYRSSLTPGLWSVIPSSVGGQRFTTLGVAGDLPISGDFDGDGRADLAVWNPATSTFTILQSTLGLRVQQIGWGGVDRPAVGDYDGDGTSDIAVYSPNGGYIAGYLSGGGGFITSITTANPATTSSVPADFDGDGKDDLTLFDQTTATWVIRRSSDGQFVTDPRNGSTMIQLGAPSNIVPTDPDVPVPGDYNGDGYADLAVFRQYRAQWWIWYGGPNGPSLLPNGGVNGAVFQFGGDIDFLPKPDVPTPGDYNGDGTTDLSIFRPTNTGEYLTWLSGSPANQKQIQRDPATGLPPKPFSPPRDGDLPVQSPYGYKASGGTIMHLQAGVTAARAVAAGASVVETPTAASMSATDFGRTALGLALNLGATPVPSSPAPGNETAPAPGVRVDHPFAAARERLLQHRRERLAAWRAARAAR